MLKSWTAQGEVQGQIQERMLRLKDVMEIEDSQGNTIVKVIWALANLLAHRFTVKTRIDNQS